MDAKELFTGMSDDVLLETAKAAFEVAKERGLQLPQAAGVLTVEKQVELQTVPITPESLEEQLPTAHQGYVDAVWTLNAGRRKNRIQVTNQEVLGQEFEAWLTEDKLDYVRAAQEADPDLRFTLVATPNVLVDAKDIAKAAKDFGKDQPYETYIYDALYNKYSAEQLSGTTPDSVKSVVYSLIPNKHTDGMAGTVADQRAQLAKLQIDNPTLKVPSVLEAITYWQTLRAGGDKLADSETFDRTYIRHFDLPEQRLGDWSRVPFSCVDDRGEPGLYGSVVRYSGGGRVSVG